MKDFGIDLTEFLEPSFEQKTQRVKEIFTGSDLVYEGRTKIFFELFKLMKRPKRDISSNQMEDLNDVFTEIFTENSQLNENPKLKDPQNLESYEKASREIRTLFMDEVFSTDNREAILTLLVDSMETLGEINGRHKSELVESVLDIMSDQF